MAPLPVNNTACLFIDYTTGGEDHTVLFRYATGSTVFDAMDAADAFFNAIDGAVFTFTILGARDRAKNSNVTLPITWTGDGSYGDSVANHAQTAWYFDFVGRTAGGRRSRIALFGAKVDYDTGDDNYRLDDTGDIGAAIAALNANDTTLCGIDELQVIWYTYANSGVNAYWRNRIR